MKLWNSALVGASLAAAASATAQIAPQMQVAPVAATQSAMLHVGTEVPLKLSEELTTKGKQLQVGQRFHMEVAEPVLVNGMTVIPAGTPAMGEITDVRNKGMWGKSGHISARILYLMVNGRQIRMSGAFDNKGTSGGIGAVATSAIVFAPAGFFMTGTSAHLPIGSAVRGFIDEDVPLAINTAAPAPLVVGVPAASAPVTAAPMTVSTGRRN